MFNLKTNTMNIENIQGAEAKFGIIFKMLFSLIRAI